MLTVFSTISTINTILKTTQNFLTPSHETWATYVERLEFYFIANGIDDPVKKRAVLLTVSGPATYKLIRNLSAPKKPSEKSYDELVALVKSHHR